MDILITEQTQPEELLSRLQAHLPMGFGVMSAEEVPLKSPSLMSSVTGFKYRIVPPSETDLSELRARVKELNIADEIYVQRKSKAKARRRGKGFRDVNIREMVAELSLVEQSGSAEVIFETKRHDEKLAKWREVLSVLGLPEATSSVIKTHTYLAGTQ
jgi:radical SAM-linked protein